MFCLIIVAIFIGLGRAYRWLEKGGNFEVIKEGEGRQATKGWNHFYGES